MKIESYLNIAIKAARRAAAIHKHYASNRIIARPKSSHFNLVTQADLEAEKIIVDLIKKYNPDHNIVGEENKYPKTQSPHTWIIDPLDGTSNFVHCLPIFSVSIALALNNELILGVVLDPMRNELFKAVKGKGAFLNGKRINVSQQGDLKQSLLITGFSYDRSKAMERTLVNIRDFMILGITGIRRLGSAALDLCYLACGRAEGFWEARLNPWDFAAGTLILKEAGGMITDYHGKAIGLEPTSVVASNGLIQSQILEVLDKGSYAGKSL
jgi:myo-inositol-1(or 4)-monophosphatase